MKSITTFFFILFSINLYAQGNFNVEWESGYFNRIDLGSFERTNSIPEIIAYDIAAGNIKVYDGATKNLKYTYSNPDTSALLSFWTYEYSMPIDVNNDGISEIGFYDYDGNTTKLKVVDGSNGQILFQNTYTGNAYPYTIDIDGDSWVEICIDFYDRTVQKYKFIILSTTSHPIGIEPQTGQVTDYHLKQNYPNPFNPSTTIEYSISRNANVQILIYNELGQLVNTLTEGQKKAGSYKAVLDGNNLASGVYFYQLIVDNVPETKKMVLVK
jgi:hypothetical protein